MPTVSLTSPVTDCSSLAYIALPSLAIRLSSSIHQYNIQLCLLLYSLLSTQRYPVFTKPFISTTTMDFQGQPIGGTKSSTKVCTCSPFDFDMDDTNNAGHHRLSDLPATDQ